MPRQPFEAVAQGAGDAGPGPLGVAARGAMASPETDCSGQLGHEVVPIALCELQASGVVEPRGLLDVLVDLGQAAPVGLTGKIVDHGQAFAVDGGLRGTGGHRHHRRRHLRRSTARQAGCRPGQAGTAGITSPCGRSPCRTGAAGSRPRLRSGDRGSWLSAPAPVRLRNRTRTGCAEGPGRFRSPALPHRPGR